MKTDYFPTLFRCVGISIAVLITVAMMGATRPWVTMLCAVAPLVYYHVFYLRPRAKGGLSQAAIDSVYYFGFLVTVAALGLSALTIAIMRGGSTDVQTIVYQFGIGLFATGYAVIARMHLTSLSDHGGEANPDAVMSRYLKRSLELVDNVETASVRLSELSQIVMARTEEVSEASRASAERAMRDVAKVFEVEMRSTLALAREGLTEVRGLVADTSFVSEREEMGRSIRATIEGATRLNGALEEMAGRAREGAVAAGQNTGSIVRFEESLGRLNAVIDDFGGEGGALLRTVGALTLVSESIEGSTKSIGQAVGSIAGIAEAAADTGPTFKSMRTLAKKASEQLDELGTISGRLDVAMSKVSAMADASHALADGLGRVSTALPALETHAEALAVGFEIASRGSERLEERLLALPEQAGSVRELGASVSVALDQVGESIRVAANNAAALSANGAETSRIIDGANQLLASAATLQSTVVSVQERLEGLVAAMLLSQKVLSDTSNGLKTSMSTSADILEADVTRSTRAAAQLTDGLIQVAQTVIDRTRQQQRMRE